MLRWEERNDVRHLFAGRGMSISVRSDVIRPCATDALLRFSTELTWDRLPASIRHAAIRHLLDTIGAMIAGAQGDVTEKAEAALSSIRAAGSVVVPGRVRRADVLDAAFLGGISAHGIELDDGFREGAVHPGAPVVSALLPLAYTRKVSGKELLVAMVAGYEAVLAVALACHPSLRRRGYHPTATIGTLGAAVAASKLLGLPYDVASNALGLSASSAAGLHAYVNGGADVKRLHAGHAAREGVQAALHAKAGIAGPPMVLEGKDGFFQALASGNEKKDASFNPAESGKFLITRCYVKPFACCRHLQPAAEALVAIANEHGIDAHDIDDILVETYDLAAELAEVGWGDFASAQLSFRFVMAAALTFRDIRLEHFGQQVLDDPSIAALCGKVRVVVTEDMQQMYPRLRPSRVTVSTPSGSYSKQVDEAGGAPEFPLSDDALGAKFLGLVSPVLGAAGAQAALDRLRSIDEEEDVSALLETLVP